MIKKIKAISQEVIAQLAFLKSENLSITDNAIQSKKIYDLASVSFVNFEKKCNFQNNTNEVEYFKVIKTQFLSHSFYFDRIIEIEKMKIFSLDKNDVFDREKKIIEYYTISNIDLYNYYKNNETKSDTVLFSHENCSSSIFGTEINFIIPSEKQQKNDIVLAHFIANEMLEKYLMNEIYLSRFEQIKDLGIVIKWTKSKSWLIESMYGFWLLDCINDGNISISDLTKIFGIFFNIDLGDAAHTFSKFKHRIESSTIFTDLVKDILLKKFKELEMKKAKL